MENTWYYYDRSGDKRGPVDIIRLRELASLGAIDPEAQIESSSDGKTYPASSFPGMNFDLKKINVKPDSHSTSDREGDYILLHRFLDLDWLLIILAVLSLPASIFFLRMPNINADKWKRRIFLRKSIRALTFMLIVNLAISVYYTLVLLSNINADVRWPVFMMISALLIISALVKAGIELISIFLSIEENTRVKNPTNE